MLCVVQVKVSTVYVLLVLVMMRDTTMVKAPFPPPWHALCTHLLSLGT